MKRGSSAASTSSMMFFSNTSSKIAMLVLVPRTTIPEFYRAVIWVHFMVESILPCRRHSHTCKEATTMVAILKWWVQQADLMGSLTRLSMDLLGLGDSHITRDHEALWNLKAISIWIRTKTRIISPNKQVICSITMGKLRLPDLRMVRL